MINELIYEKLGKMIPNLEDLGDIAVSEAKGATPLRLEVHARDPKFFLISLTEEECIEEERYIYRTMGMVVLRNNSRAQAISYEDPFKKCGMSIVQFGSLHENLVFDMVLSQWLSTCLALGHRFTSDEDSA